MADFCIITDSGCDLGAEMLKNLDLIYTPLCTNINHQTHYFYPGEGEMSYKDFYDAMRAGAAPSTTATTSVQWVDNATAQLEAGKDVLMMPFSSGLSATYQSAAIAAEELRERFPERRIEVLDTRCASLGLGLLLWHVVRLKNAGADLDAVIAYVERHKMQVAHWVTVDSLLYLCRGGRISKSSAVAGTVLGIKPIIHVDNEGKLESVGKCRGRKAALQALAKKVAETAVEPEKNMVFICHSDCPEDAKRTEQFIRARTNIGGCYIAEFGTVIGSHTGPGCIAVFFYATGR